MKKNGMQIATLALCAVLLFVALGQRRQLDDLENRLSGLDREFSREIDELTRNFTYQLEQTQRIVADHSLEPRGIDMETRALLADVSVTLKEWYADTAVTVIAQLEDDAVVELPTEGDDAGTFTARLAIPLEGGEQVRLDAEICSNGLMRKESLDGWGEFALMLPLKSGGSGYSGPDYREGVLSSRVDVEITSGYMDRIPEKITNPRFTTYLNGDLVLTQAAAVSTSMSSDRGICYTVDTENNEWSIACAVGDTVEIRFLCEDVYGLGYEFSCMTWQVTGETPDNQTGATMERSDTLLSLYWPE